MATFIDEVTLVTEADEVLGSMDKFAAHRNPAQLHRAISVFLFNSKGELLIQQRSSHKIVGQEQWANTCCGNVWPSETYLECAQRRLSAELGITDTNLSDMYTFLYETPCNQEFGEHEMDHVFVGIYNGLVQPNSKEVARYEWIEWSTMITQDWRVSELHQGIWGAQALNREWTPWFSKLMQRSEATKAITESIK